MTGSWCSDGEARERGRALRAAVGLDAHAELVLAPGRPGVEEFLRARSAGRLADLLPLGHGRMSANAFAFYRGSAGLMAHDLAQGSVTGLTGQICGDAHAANFGLYGTHDGRILMDINDFDETAVGPWEWDLKRLATSVVLAGRTGAEVGDKAGRRAAHDAAKAYRKAFGRLAAQPFADSWSALGDESAIEQADADALFDDFRRAASAAARNTSERAAVKLAHRHGEDGWHFVADPPILSELPEDTRRAVLDALPAYQDTLRWPWRQLVDRYRARDAAMRVVGTGSVGMRCYLVLLQGNDDEALVLQVKQVGPSALAPYLPQVEEAHHGARVVLGALLMQAETDQLFGWTSVDGSPYVVRQFRNRKGSIDPILLNRGHLDDYARLAGSLLARAHSRTIDPRVLAAYFEDGSAFDDAVAEFALAYAGHVERDHAEMVELIASGRVETAADD
ncbi:DUF2252 domain-containing protein [Nocardioides hungaricus]